MVVYEVNLEIDPDIYDDFFLWLQGHMAEIISLPGFVKAVVYRDAASTNLLVVHYHLVSMDALDYYSEHHAPRLRAEAEKKYPGQFKAWRRILKKESNMEA